MGVAEAISDDGSLTGRGGAWTRGLITGIGTFVGGTGHAVPFLINDVHTALAIAYVVVGIELLVVALVQKRFRQGKLAGWLVQVTLVGIVVAFVGFAVGHG